MNGTASGSIAGAGVNEPIQSPHCDVGQSVDVTFPHKGRGWIRTGRGVGSPAVMVVVEFVQRIVDVTGIYKWSEQVVRKEEQALCLPVPQYVIEVWFGLTP